MLSTYEGQSFSMSCVDSKGFVIEADTVSYTHLEMMHENTDINSVLKNALGKFNSVVSVNSLV